MNVSEPFIRRPIATSLLMLGVLVFGVAAYGLLPVAALPNVDFPTITVSASYPGAEPGHDGLGRRHAARTAIRGDPRLDQMTSTSGVGTTSITLQFDLSRNIDGAAQDVQQAINAASGLLPSDLPSPPTYRKTNPADRPVLIFAVHSDAIPVYRIDDYAYTILAQKLSTVPGVSEVADFRPEALCGACADQPRGVGLARPRLRGCAQCAGRDDPQPAERRSRRRSPGLYPRHQRPVVRRRRLTTTSSSPTATAPRSGSRMSAGRSIRSQNDRDRRLVRRDPGRGSGDPAPARRQHDRAGRHDQGDDAAARAVDPAIGQGRADGRSLAGDPRRGA